MKKTTLEKIGEKFMDLANYALAGLTFVSIVASGTNSSLNYKIFSWGIILWFTFLLTGVLISEMGGN